MKILPSLELTRWTPDFSDSGQSSPEWTRISSSEGEVTNSLEWVEWESNPVQVHLCDTCGHAGCETGNYVHFSRLNALVIGSAPEIDETDSWEVEEITPSQLIRKNGGFGIPFAEWERVHALCDSVPSAQQFPPLTRRSLANIWRMTPLGESRVEDLDSIVPMLKERLLATDTLEPSQAIPIIEQLLDWLRADPESHVKGTIRSPVEIEANVETLYFDGPSVGDWPAFALVSGEILLSIGTDLVLDPRGDAA